MKFQGPRFLLVFFAWLLLIVPALCLVFLNSRQQHAIFSALTDLPKFWSKLYRLVQFMDDWNYTLLIALLAIFVLVLCANEIFIKRYFPSTSETSTSATVTGLVWLGRTVCNTALLLAEITTVCYLINFFVSTPRIHAMNQIPDSKYTLLLLGTSKYIGEKHDKPNAYYLARIEASVELYKKGLIKRIVISGDHTGNYNEPLDMKIDLTQRGVKNVPIVLDGQGYRTFDSIIRIRQLFGEDTKLIIVSQYFHLERALFLASKSGIDAIGVAADGHVTTKMIEREWLAKTKVLLDIYILNTQTAGVSVQPRRAVNFNRPSDLVILLFVLSLVGISGRMSRQLLSY